MREESRFRAPPQEGRVDAAFVLVFCLNVGAWLFSVHLSSSISPDKLVCESLSSNFSLMDFFSFLFGVRPLWAGGCDCICGGAAHYWYPCSHVHLEASWVWSMMTLALPPLEKPLL